MVSRLRVKGRVFGEAPSHHTHCCTHAQTFTLVVSTTPVESLSHSTQRKHGGMCVVIFLGKYINKTTLFSHEKEGQAKHTWVVLSNANAHQGSQETTSISISISIPIPISVSTSFSPDVPVLVLLPALRGRAPCLRVHHLLPHGQQLVQAVGDLEPQAARRSLLAQAGPRGWSPHHGYPPAAAAFRVPPPSPPPPAAPPPNAAGFFLCCPSYAILSFERSGSIFSRKRFLGDLLIVKETEPPPPPSTERSGTLLSPPPWPGEIFSRCLLFYLSCLLCLASSP